MAAGPPTAPGRGSLDALYVRFPALSTLTARALLRLRPGSRLRRRAINLQATRNFAALARSDVEFLILSYETDAEIVMKSMAGVGMEETYRGHDGIRAMLGDLDDAFSSWAWIPRLLVDGGDRFAVRAQWVGRGRSSDVSLEMTGATAIRLSPQGRVAWQEWFVEDGAWMKALAAVDLTDR
jgi:hypothetical protein